MESLLIKTLKKVIFENYTLEINDIKLDIPPKKELGDFAFACFVLSKDLKKNPGVIASELALYLKSEDIIESSQTEGAYLNIKLNKNIFINKILKFSLKNNLGLIQENNKNKNIIIDYIGANVGKPLHIGHMCTPNQGQVLINLYQKLGYNVISDSHIGDWGIIFGKLIFAYKKWGDENKLKENAVDYLLSLYVKVTSESKLDDKIEELIRNEFKLLSKGDLESIKLWEKFTSYSIKAMQVQLDRLNIKSDFNIGESFYEGIGLPKLENYPDLKWNMLEIVKELINKNIASKNDDGSVGVIFDEESKIPSCVLQKRDGTHGYLASDLACIKYRIDNWNPYKIVYFVDVRQSMHLKQAFKIATLAGWIKNTELFHAYNGFISLKDGAMSTRTGRIIKLDSLLDEGEIRAKKIILEKRNDIVGEELNNLSKIIGIGAIKYGYLKKSRKSDVIFDWDEFMNFEGNSGPYIQYAYVRAIKILKKSQIFEFEINDKNIDFGDEYDFILPLIKNILKYTLVLQEVSITKYPHILATYSYELTKSFNAFYNNVHVLNEKNKNLLVLKLRLVELFSKVLKDSFGILGIDMPEKM